MRMLTTLSLGNRRPSSRWLRLLCSVALMLSLFFSGPLAVSASDWGLPSGNEFNYLEKWSPSQTAPAVSGTVSFGTVTGGIDFIGDYRISDLPSWSVSLKDSNGNITGTVRPTFSTDNGDITGTSGYAYRVDHYEFTSVDIYAYNPTTAYYNMPSPYDIGIIYHGVLDSAPVVSNSSPFGGVSIHNVVCVPVFVVDGVEHEASWGRAFTIPLEMPGLHSVAFRVRLSFDVRVSFTDVHVAANYVISPSVSLSCSVPNYYMAVRSSYFQRALITGLYSMAAGLHRDLQDIKAGLTLDRTNELLSQGNQLQQENNNKLDNLTTGYDSTAGNSTNDKLSGSLDGFTSSEDAIVGGAESGVNALDIDSFFDFVPGLLSGLSLVTVFADGFILASGDLAFIFPFLYVLVLVTLIMGIWRFRR